MSSRRPATPVPDDGYRWWYLDGTSDDRRHAVTAIVFIGSVFSPWYALARRRRATPALAHCAVNVALYGPAARWCMTERGASAVRADASSLAIGPTRLDIGEARWRLDVDERSAPYGRALRGTIEVDAGREPQVPSAALDAGGLHHWQPIRPQTRIRVSMRDPALSWEGSAYVDTNRGAVPLERTFTTWHWSRAHAAPDGSTLVRYDVLERERGERLAHAVDRCRRRARGGPRGGGARPRSDPLVPHAGVRRACATVPGSRRCAPSRTPRSTRARTSSSARTARRTRSSTRVST